MYAFDLIQTIPFSFECHPNSYIPIPKKKHQMENKANLPQVTVSMKLSTDNLVAAMIRNVI